MTDLRRWSTYFAVLLIVGVLGFLLLNRQGSRDPDSSPSPSASELPAASTSQEVGTSPSPTLTLLQSPTQAPTPTMSPTPTPAPTPSPQPTLAPTPVPTPVPTPAPSTGILPCLPEPNGYAVNAPNSVTAGQNATIDIQGLPQGQKVVLSVKYADGSTVVIGTRYASAPDAGGWTHASFTWTIPAIPGIARASWTIPCTGGRNLDGYRDITVA